MCGFTFILSDYDRDLPFLINSAHQSIQYRGPDYTNSISGSVDRYYFSAAHSRLAIQDTNSSDSNQPLNNNTFLLLYNGEIFNLQELESRFNIASASDTLFL